MGVRRWAIDYDGLTQAEGVTLDAHFESAGYATGFVLATPNRTSEATETLSNVHYEKYERPAHVSMAFHTARLVGARRRLMARQRPPVRIVAIVASDRAIGKACL